MKYKGKLHEKISFLYLCVCCGMILLLVYLGVNQNSQVFQKDKEQGYRQIENIKCIELEDSNTPIGIRKEYILESLQVEDGDNCLAFYLVHHYAQVYVEDELIYSLTPQDESFVNKTTGCNWAMIPLSHEDEDKEIRVVVTPVYKDVSNRSVDFLVGSKYAIIASQLRDDVTDIVMSALAIAVGLVFMLISLFSFFQKKGRNSLFHLGVFSCFMGIWKITDIRSAPLIFTHNTMLLSQISLTMLILAVVPFATFISTQFKNREHKLLDFACFLSIAVAALQILLQFIGIADLRESLELSHVAIAVTGIAVVQAVISEWRRKGTGKKLWITFACFVLCAAGSMLDILLFYIKGTSYEIANTIAVFWMYIVIMGTMAIMEMNRQASIDFATGLYNRSRCSELLKDESVIDEDVCLMMFDLNQLKKVNDVFGHEAGDEMISQFAEILRQNIPGQAFLGRYGGDEFISVINGCDKEKALKILTDIKDAVKEYNCPERKVKLSCSAGYALSSDYLGCTMPVLLEKADNNMYQDKRSFYENVSREC